MATDTLIRRLRPMPVPVALTMHAGPALEAELPRLGQWLRSRGAGALSRDLGWLKVLRSGLGHTPYCLEARSEGQTTGVLPLALVKSWLFGKHIVSLPYLNAGGVIADDAESGRCLVDAAVVLADEFDVRHLELRHEEPIEHPALTHQLTSKVHMRLALPATADELFQRLNGKVRNQVRKGQKSELTVSWGGEEMLADFYDVFARNMRDLGTPVYGQELFRSVLREFGTGAELCVVRAGDKAIAAGLLLHGAGITEVPSASSLREFNSTCANMLLYWHLLTRAIERGQSVFDFGRCSIDGNTYRFKKQWGAEPAPATWQYYVRKGDPTAMRPDNPKYQRFIRCWQRLPVWLSRWLGPRIVRGIP